MVPEQVSSAGREASELARSAKLEMDPWQDAILDASLGERPDGSWASFEVGLIVGRQNGKGSIIEARELAGLFLFGEKLIIHSAHEFKTSKEHFRRVLQLIESNPDFDSRVKRVSRSHGEEGVELKGGARLLFATRTGGGGRGFSGDLVVLDEAYNLGDHHMAALMPTLAARPNPQIWYTSSAPDKDLAPCEALSRLRRRALAGGAPRLAYFEWSAEVHTEFCSSSCREHDDLDDAEVWRRTNPGFGIRISEEFIRAERAAMSGTAFARERLGVGNYVVESAGWKVISKAAWEGLVDADSVPLDPVAFAVDVTPERSMGSISVAGRRADGLLHGGVVEHRSGTGWVVDRLAELSARWKPCAVVIDGRGPAASLIPALDEAGVAVVKASSADMAQACGGFYDAVVENRLRHQGLAPLASALAAAEKRKLGDSWAWTRESVSADISPLVATTLALWGHATRGHAEPDLVELEGSLMA